MNGKLKLGLGLDIEHAVVATLALGLLGLCIAVLLDSTAKRVAKR